MACRAVEGRAVTEINRWMRTIEEAYGYLWPSLLSSYCCHYCCRERVTGLTIVVIEGSLSSFLSSSKCYRRAVEGRGVVTELNHEMDSINKWKGYREGLEDIYGHHCSCNPIAAAIAVIVQEVQSLTIVIMSSSEY